MYKRVFSCTRAFIFYKQMWPNCRPRGGIAVGKAVESPKVFISPQKVKQELRKVFNCRFNYEYRRSSPGIGVSLSGVGFSLSFLGFLNKEDDKLTPEDKILMEMKRAILAIQEGEIQKAESHLAMAWKMSTEQELEKAKTQILDIRANLAFQIGDLDTAEKLFKTVCQRLIYHQEVSVKDNAVVEISIKLSQIMALKGKREESMTGFQYCADTQKEKIEKEGINDEDTLLLAAWSLHSLAQEYLSKGTQNNVDLDLVRKASDLATEAYTYASTAIGPDSQQALAISSDLASILALQGDVDAALERYKECEAIAAEKHTYLQAAIHVNTGSLYLQKGNYDEAERLCKEAKKLAGQFKDKESAMRAEECIVRSSAMKAANADISQQSMKQEQLSSSKSSGTRGSG